MQSLIYLFAQAKCYMNLCSLHRQGFLPSWDELYPLCGKPRDSPRCGDVLKQRLEGARVPYVSWSAWPVSNLLHEWELLVACVLAAQLPSGFLLVGSLQPPGPQQPGLSVVRGAQRMAVLAVRPSSLFGKADKQFLLPHAGIAEAERMPVGPQPSHQEMIFLGNAVFTPWKNKYYGFPLAETKQMLLLAGARGLIHELTHPT